MLENRKSYLALIVLCCLLVSLTIVPSSHAAWWKWFLLQIERTATWLGIVEASLALLEYDLGEVQTDIFEKNKEVNAVDKELDRYEERKKEVQALYGDATNRAMSANSRILSIESDLEHARARKSEAWQAIRWYIENYSQYWLEPGYIYWQEVRQNWEAAISDLNTQLDAAKSEKSSAEVDIRMYESKLQGIQGLINGAETVFEALIVERTALKKKEEDILKAIDAKEKERKKADDDAEEAIEDYETEKRKRPDDPPPQ